MSAESVSENFRGVHCRRCGKPVRVPSLVIKKDSASRQEHNAEDTEYQLISRVFVLRCHSCFKESIYAINQIEDFTFVAQPRASLARQATV